MSTTAELYLKNRNLESRAAGLRALGVLTDFDLLLVDTVAMRFGESDSLVLMGLAMAVRALRMGNVGVNLIQAKERCEQELMGSIGAAGEVGPEAVEDPDALLPADTESWPTCPQEWQRAVLASPMVYNLNDGHVEGTEPLHRGDAPCDGSQESRCPFVAQHTKEGVLIMTQRMWREQERLAHGMLQIANRTSGLRPQLDQAAVDAGILSLFGAEEANGEGAKAVRLAAMSPLTVVTGGPGTGKTYSIKRLLALLIAAQQERYKNQPLRIELAAPTGKAAVRMAEAMGEDLSSFPVAPQVREVLQNLEPRTLHRLLGVRPDGISCRHDRENPLAVDVVVVDEASMVDLVLMRRLVEALPVGARLVLLGDKDQLASVEAGTVLADLVSSRNDQEGGTAGPLADCIATFTHSHRFKSAPSVAATAAALQAGDQGSVDRAARLLCAKERVDDHLPDRIRHLGLPLQGGRPSPASLDTLASPYLFRNRTSGRDSWGYAGLLAESLEQHGARSEHLLDRTLRRELLEALDRYRILAVHRRGPMGVSGLIEQMERRIRAYLAAALGTRSSSTAGGNSPATTSRLPATGSHWLGQPILITENAYDINLMNGDVGLVLPGDDRKLVAVFPSQTKAGDVRPIALSRLPQHTGALVMTVHKSQGSQFDRVALVLAGRQTPIQTRELIYTGITRTKARLDWLGDPEELHEALGRKVSRASGLSDLLFNLHH